MSTRWIIASIGVQEQTKLMHVTAMRIVVTFGRGMQTPTGVLGMSVPYSVWWLHVFIRIWKSFSSTLKIFALYIYTSVK